MNPKVDFYFNKAKTWQQEIEKLRTIVLDCDLKEELKWGVPCYQYNGKNVVLIHTFKEYCGLLFFKGVLIKDPAGILVQQTANVQSSRQMRFTNFLEIIELQETIKAYIAEAIEVEKSGLKVEFKKTEDYTMPAEFKSKLDQIPALKIAFENLTPGRQKAYLLYFSSAKQAATRTARVEKYMPAILNGKGMDN